MSKKSANGIFFNQQAPRKAKLNTSLNSPEDDSPDCLIN